MNFLLCLFVYVVLSFCHLWSVAIIYDNFTIAMLRSTRCSSPCFPSRYNWTYYIDLCWTILLLMTASLTFQVLIYFSSSSTTSVTIFSLALIPCWCRSNFKSCFVSLNSTCKLPTYNNKNTHHKGLTSNTHFEI